MSRHNEIQNAYRCLDYSPDMIAQAQRRAGNLGLKNVRFLQGDVGKLPFADDSFDLMEKHCEQVKLKTVGSMACFTCWKENLYETGRQRRLAQIISTIPCLVFMRVKYEGMNQKMEEMA